MYGAQNITPQAISELQMLDMGNSQKYAIEYSNPAHVSYEQ